MKVVVKLDHGSVYQYHLVDMTNELFDYLMSKKLNKTYNRDPEIKKTKIKDLWKASNFEFGSN